MLWWLEQGDPSIYRLKLPHQVARGLPLSTCNSSRVALLQEIQCRCEWCGSTPAVVATASVFTPHRTGQQPSRRSTIYRSRVHSSKGRATIASVPYCHIDFAGEILETAKVHRPESRFMSRFDLNQHLYIYLASQTKDLRRLFLRPQTVVGPDWVPGRSNRAGGVGMVPASRSTTYDMLRERDALYTLHVGWCCIMTGE